MQLTCRPNCRIVGHKYFYITFFKSCDTCGKYQEIKTKNNNQTELTLKKNICVRIDDKTIFELSNFQMSYPIKVVSLAMLA